MQIMVQLPLPTRFYARPVANYAQKEREVKIRAYGLGRRPSPAEPKPATWLGDWGPSCKLRHWAEGSGLSDMDMWGVVANYAQKGFSASPFSVKLERQSAKLCRCAQSS